MNLGLLGLALCTLCALGACAPDSEQPVDAGAPEVGDDARSGDADRDAAADARDTDAEGSGDDVAEDAGDDTRDAEVDTFDVGEDTDDVREDVDVEEDADVALGPPPERGLAWTVELAHGSFGSPRALPDRDEPTLLLGYGNEDNFEGTEDDQRGGSLSTFDASTGERLTRHRTDDELFTIPVPMQSEDGETTWLVGGRNAALLRIDPAADAPLWAFAPAGDEARELGLYNFYQPRRIADVTGDGADDVLVTNGGDYLAPPNSSRDPGYVMVLDGETGAVVQQLTVPDGQETYMGLTFWERPEGTYAVFGTGGETLLGQLWAAPLDGIVGGNLASAERIVEGNADRGFIAPPAYALLNDDAWYDLISYAFSGRISVLSGFDASPLWVYEPDEPGESPATPALGDFDGDGDVDIFVAANAGIFPAWSGVTYRVFDGLTGEALFASEPREGGFVASSSLAGDVDGDGLDEAIVAEVTVFGVGANDIVSRFYLFHLDEQRFELLFELGGLAGGAGWLGDVDLDGYAELLVSTAANPIGWLARYNFDAPAAGIRWGGYFGSNHDGRY